MVRLNVSRADNIFDTLPSELRELVFSYAQSKYIWKLKTADGKTHYEWAPPHDKETAMAYGEQTPFRPQGLFWDAYMQTENIDPHW